MNKLQQIDLEILKEIIQLCAKYHLKYYALGGTLLGAVRHQGFIPWDDDVDIALPRPDYERLLQVLDTELSKNYEAQNYHHRHDGVNPQYITQVGRRGTQVLCETALVPTKKMIWVDVFPLDAMPSQNLTRQIHKYHLLYRRMLYKFSVYENTSHQHLPNRPLHEKALMKFREVTKIGSNWDPVEICAQTERIACKYEYANEDYLVNLFGAYKFKEMFPKTWFGEGIQLPFEDISINCPVEYEKVLEQMYGDYMTPPSEEERRNHHCLTIISTGELAAS